MIYEIFYDFSIYVSNTSHKRSALNSTTKKEQKIELTYKTQQNVNE